MNEAKLGINLIKQTNPDLIIAIGGGSVIDMAKLINILASQHTDNFEIVKNNQRIQNKGLPLIAIPTTAGTGSEATHFAVVYIDKVKYSLAHEYILPDYAIIAPALSYNLPRHIIASSGLDALSQAIESYWAIGSTIESKQYAAEAISLILPAIKKAVCEQNKPAIYSMAIAANLAGKAINISKTTAAHALSYPITTHFNIPHGHAVALTLGKFFIINSLYNANDIQDKRGEIYLNKTMKELFTLFGCNDAQSCCAKWYKLVAQLGLKNEPRQVGIKSKREITIISDNINIERLSNNPVEINKDTIEKILKQRYFPNASFG